MRSIHSYDSCSIVHSGLNIYLSCSNDTNVKGSRDIVMPVSHNKITLKSR